MYKILLIGNNNIFFYGLSYFITRQILPCEVHRAEDRNDCLQKVAHNNYDLAIIYSDIMDTIPTILCHDMLAKNQALKVLVYLPEPAHLFESCFIKMGAYGYAMHSNSAENLLQAVDSILSGKKYYSELFWDEIIGRLLDSTDGRSDSLHSLSKREFDILYCSFKHMDTNSICTVTQVSLSNIYTCRKSIIKKLGVTDIRELFVSKGRLIN